MNRPQWMRSVILLIFFRSGISVLIYQIVWTRMLVLVFGNPLLATSAVLSAFMAGLAAGSFFLGEHIDRKRRPLLKVYAVLEAGIGLFGLAFPALFAAMVPVYAASYQSFGENLIIANLFRFLICFVLIVLPTFCMGGTLPVLRKHFAGKYGRFGYQVGFLYGLNTAGAVLGCAAAGGYWLLGTVACVAPPGSPWSSISGWRGSPGFFPRATSPNPSRRRPGRSRCPSRARALATRRPSWPRCSSGSGCPASAPWPTRSSGHGC